MARPRRYLRQRLGDVFRTLAKQKECQVVEGHPMPDHVHMLISIPPKYSVAQAIGYIKGKSAIHVARTFFDERAVSDLPLPRTTSRVSPRPFQAYGPRRFGAEQGPRRRQARRGLGRRLLPAPTSRP